MQLLVLHGPNLNLLGRREPGLYGHLSLDAIQSRLQQEAARLTVNLDCFQSNHEGELVDRIIADYRAFGTEEMASGFHWSGLNTP